MSKIIIKKRISLGFLGEEYSDAELVFRAIPLSDYDKLVESMPIANPRMQELGRKSKEEELTEEEQSELSQLLKDNANTNKESIHTVLKYLKEYFLSGKFPDESGEMQSLSPADIDGLDQEAAMKCFELLTGQLSDPKGQ